ncbi:hypothetical protein Plhal304r1_c013g0049031 [Plasmopara halstedii]
MEVSFELKDVTAGKNYGVRRQIMPVNRSRHTKIKKASKASPVMQVTESILDDKNRALRNTLTDLLAEPGRKVDRVSKLFEKVTNINKITEKVIKCPLGFNSVLSLKLTGNGLEIAELAELHTINRVLPAPRPGKNLAFTAKWKK